MDFLRQYIDLLLIFCRTFARQVVGVPTSTCKSDPDCLSDKFPLLSNQRVGLIDPDTPDSAKTITSNDGKTLKLTVRWTCLRPWCQTLMFVVFGRIQH